MTYHIDWLPNEPILFGKIDPEYDARRDTPAASARAIELFESSPVPVTYILDLTEMKIDFGEMVAAMGLLTRGDLAVFVHPKLAELNIVTQSKLITLGAGALGQAQYGGRKANVFATVEAALAYVRGNTQPAAA